MAEVDNDWNTFINTARADYQDKPADETVDEDLDDSDDEEVDDAAKKPTKQADDKGDDAEDDDSEEDQDDDDEADDSDEDDDKSKTPKSTYKPRLKQFFNDKGELDHEKIETGYINSSKEAVKLNSELKAEREARLESNTNFQKLAKAIQDNEPELAKKIFDGDTLKELAKPAADPKAEDPYARDYSAKLRKASLQEYDDFVELNPEAITDPDRAEKIGKYLKFYGDWYKSENDGEIPSMKIALEAAYRHHGWDVEKAKKESVATAAKKTAANRSTASGKKTAKKSEVSTMEAKFAHKLGIKL